MKTYHEIFQKSFSLYGILRNRAMFLSKGHEALLKNDFRDLTDMWMGPAPKEALRPLELSFYYSTLIFHMSAMETWFLNLFINSAHFYESKNKKKLEGARDIIRRKIKANNNVDFLTLSDYHQELVSASFSSLNTAEKLFSEIYGKRCFLIALGEEEYFQFKQQHEQWHNKRNGILHRGGEGKHKDFIYVTAEEIKEIEKATLKFVIKFTEWCSQNI